MGDILLGYKQGLWKETKSAVSDTGAEAVASHPRARLPWVRLASVAIVVMGVIAPALGTYRVGQGRRDRWLLGDWLIDYSAGFTRRGLAGEAIRQLSEATGVDRIIATTALQLTVLAALAVAVLVLVWNHDRGLTTVLLVGSPAFVLFLINPLGTMRKEVLLWLLVAGVLAWSKTRSAPAGRIIPWLLALGFPVLVLVHEALAFYAGFIAVVLWLLVADKVVTRREASVAGVVGGVLAGVALAVSALWPGSGQVGSGICDTLVQAGYSDALCSGAISFLDRDAGAGISLVGDQVLNGGYLVTYFVVVVLATIPFVFVRVSKTLLVALGVSLLCTFPLFVVAIDWGRWIVISVWLVTLVVLRFDGTDHVTVKPLRPKTRASLFFGAALVATYATLWSVPHCCAPRVGFGLIDRIADVGRFFVGG